ncbi:MAG: alanine--tRNA ligase [Oscillospiraceae bacterium]|nr:alanine--tRNA ligase [Oscillospiraceae bacterium]
MKKYGLNELREMFLSFFEEKDHLRLQSFPLIPQNDASLLLINSGMAPMKPWFTGEQEPPRKRVCTCQKCVRTGDIENVGKTARHGTYFEMLGNFSFGDYFKSEAIAWCWEFLTERLGMDPALLYPSVYIEDEQAYNIWKDEIGIAPERIVKLGKEDNFWDHGSGPCGPCSEVYFDRGEARGCGSDDCAPGCDCDRYVEIWNNVFTQFDNDGSGNYSELSQKNIDTGLGLERLACVCQDVENLFEVDTIVSIMNKVSAICGIAYGKSEKSDMSLRVITDHIRSSTMMICDGVLPSNEGRGYVLRRLLRRAARHGRLLGIDGLFLYELCDAVIENNKSAYPDLVEKKGFIARIIRIEEENFGKTIDVGTTILNGFMEQCIAAGEKTLSGEDAFKLYDTYGFPPDLTVEILAENGLDVDLISFDKHMDEQRSRARKARELLGDLAWAGIDLGLDNTPTIFSGYENLRDNALVLAIVAQGELCASIREGDEGTIVLDKTPFYAEMGGQSADFGTISCGNAVFDVRNVQQNNGGKYLHHGKVRSGEISVDSAATAEIDVSRRKAIMRAHSATHLLHEALRSTLGEHVRQAGSLVEPDKLRFDFTHYSALTADELAEVESKVNAAILDGLSICVDEMPLNDARDLGAIALFGEKYGDVVRVVKIGGDYSIELCGGTHLDNTAKAGAFSLSSEFSVASGVRRIEATTGMVTIDALNVARGHLSTLSGILKAGAPADVIMKAEQSLQTIRDLRAKLESEGAKAAGSESEQLLNNAKPIEGLQLVASIIDGANSDKLRQMSDSLRDRSPDVVAVLAAVNDGKITIVAACGKSAIDRGIKAGDIIREVSKHCGGSGGGKPDFAMGGGKDAGLLREALDTLDIMVAKSLSHAGN